MGEKACKFQQAPNDRVRQLVVLMQLRQLQGCSE